MTAEIEYHLVLTGSLRKYTSKSRYDIYMSCILAEEERCLRSLSSHQLLKHFRVIFRYGQIVYVQ